MESIIPMPEPGGANPLLSDFRTVRGTVPFSKIKNEHFLPAFQAAIAEAREEVRQITENPETPDFRNTIEALEGSGKRLSVIRKIFFNLNSAETSEEMQQIAVRVAPMLSEFGNDIMLNEALFIRVKKVYQQADKRLLNPEQQTLLENTYLDFVRSGANLGEAGKKRYRDITARLSTASLKFQENVLAETNMFFLNITDEADLAGLPEYVRETAALTARQHNKQGWMFTLHQPSYVPFMKYADNRKLRERMFRAFSSRGNHDDEYDNKALIREMVSLKLEKANLLGYSTHAAYRLKLRMEESPEKVTDFLEKLHRASRPFAEKEYAAVSDFARESGLEGPLQRWDWAWYSEKLKERLYGFSEEEIKPYFELDKVVEGVFLLAKKLYGLELKLNTGIEVCHPDVKACEVFGEAGEFVAVLYLDFFPREGKRGGAWMTDFRDQYIEGGENVRPHVSIVTNFTRPTALLPSLLSFYEVTTFLHEFGHALHGMLSQCRYRETSGTNVPRDFVELPSQLLENWAYEKEWLDLFAAHYNTGEKIPEELIRKIIAAKNFQSGFFSERQLSFGLLDMAYHHRNIPLVEDVAELEARAMAPTELFPSVEGALQSTSFSHIFSGGYDAGYYSYKWAEVLEADVFSEFREKGIFDRATADSFRINILEKGGSEPPMVLYKRFRGKEPSIDALLEKSGLKDKKQAGKQS